MGASPRDSECTTVALAKPGLATSSARNEGCLGIGGVALFFRNYPAIGGLLVPAHSDSGDDQAAMRRWILHRQEQENTPVRTANGRSRCLIREKRLNYSQQFLPVKGGCRRKPFLLMIEVTLNVRILIVG